jgi:hypothetical protein
MRTGVSRQTPDLSAFPDLVVIYLGMRAYKLRGIRTLAHFGPLITASVRAKPDGLLLHESVYFGIWPLHLGMRQYWRDFDSLESWARSLPHQKWWTDFLRNTGGTTFWHEAYFANGGMEAIFDDLNAPIGMSAFAPMQDARGARFSARKRARRGGDSVAPHPAPETDY